MYMIAIQRISFIAFASVILIASLFSITCGNGANDNGLPSDTLQPMEQPRNGPMAHTATETADIPGPPGTPESSSPPVVVVVPVDEPGGTKPTDMGPASESSSSEPEFDPRRLLAEFNRSNRNVIDSHYENYHGPCYIGHPVIEYWHPPYSVRWTPDGKQLLFNSNLPGLGFGVNIVEVDSSRLRRLVNNYAEISFDYTRLLLQTLLQERSMPTSYVEPLMEALIDEVYLSLDNPPPVSGGGHFDVSPDGTRIAYSACYPDDVLADILPDDLSWTLSVDLYERYDLDVVIANIDGSEPQLLTINKARDEFPVWSPDGSQIAFFSHSLAQTYPSGVHRIAPDSRGDGSVVATSAGLPQPPAWSPDGTRIAYVAIENQFRSRVLHTAALDGSQPTRVSDTLSGPAWSPDGKYLALAKPHGDEIALFIMNADGSDARMTATITSLEAFESERSDYRALVRSSPPWIQAVSWSPEGNHILFSCDAGVCIVHVDGEIVGQSPADLGRVLAASWSPDGSRVAVLSHTKVGRTVLYAMDRDGSDVHILY